MGTNLIIYSHRYKKSEISLAPILHFAFCIFYSYLPALRRATSSEVRKRQAPRFKFFLVRPA